MSLVEHLERLGGVASRKALIRLTCRADLEAALASGDVVRIARGRYALAVTDDMTRQAAAVGGVLGRTSAAIHRGWAVETVPAKPHLVVPWRLPKC